MPSEIVARFTLTPELWFRASRCVLRREHRWLSPRVIWPGVVGLLAALGALDGFLWSGEGLLPLLILLNVLVPLACALLCLTPTLLRRRFDQIYRRLPEPNRQAVWRFSPFAVSAEGGMTRFDGGWDDLREIVQTPDFFLVFRHQRSAGVIPSSAFADPQSVEDFIYLARANVSKYTELTHPV